MFDTTATKTRPAPIAAAEALPLVWQAEPVHTVDCTACMARVSPAIGLARCTGSSGALDLVQREDTRGGLWTHGVRVTRIAR